MEKIVFSILGIALALFISFGLFGAFDDDKDNPFKSE